MSAPQPSEYYDVSPKPSLSHFVPKDKIGFPTPRPRKERSAPVRNTAFRDSEELRALQKQLNSRK